MQTNKKKNKLKLDRDSESVDIYIDIGEDKDPIHILYYHADEWIENPEIVVPAITEAIELFYTNPAELLRVLGYFKYIKLYNLDI